MLSGVDEVADEPEAEEGECALGLSAEAVVGLVGEVAPDEGAVGELALDGVEVLADAGMVAGDDAHEGYGEVGGVEGVVRRSAGGRRAWMSSSPPRGPRS